jgi:hypothetical protein
LRSPFANVSSRRDRAAPPQRDAVYQFRQLVAAGSLMSYGGNRTDQYRLVGIYAGPVLRGTDRVLDETQRFAGKLLLLSLRMVRPSSNRPSRKGQAPTSATLLCQSAPLDSIDQYRILVAGAGAKATGGRLFIRFVGTSRVKCHATSALRAHHAFATRSADFIVFTSSMVTVIGPTPPGTGVM